MKFLKILVLSTSLALLPISGFSQNIDKYSQGSPALQVVQNQLFLDKSTVKNASLYENKDGTFGGLQIEIKPSASKDFVQLTKPGIGKIMNLVLNNKIISSAKIKSTLQNQFLVTDITKEEAQLIIDLLKK